MQMRWERTLKRYFCGAYENSQQYGPTWGLRTERAWETSAVGGKEAVPSASPPAAPAPLPHHCSADELTDTQRLRAQSPTNPRAESVSARRSAPQRPLREAIAEPAGSEMRHRLSLGPAAALARRGSWGAALQVVDPSRPFAHTS